ncbi:MAG: pyruvate formate lyase activating enzyme [Candidatus Atribacteria bacterium]|nr:pyruvate formate lyase activating enzyme [Candidatus Atribacteria bacterium]
MSKVANFWETEQDQKVNCLLCPHHCSIAPGKSGICRVRKNEAGVLIARTFARVSAVNFDPIEKKPLYHFYPGQSILSLGSVGCNFHCLFCQNWEISQVDPDHFPLQKMSPSEAVDLANTRNSIGLAYTYNEPFIWWEYVHETAELAKKSQLKNVLVTNGFVETKPLQELLPLIDAMNIDLKSMENSFYRKYCGGELEPVIRTIETSYQFGVHIELTNLLIPGLNEEEEQLVKLVDWVSTLSPDIPLHFSRYFPAYRLSSGLPTSLSMLERAYRIAREKLSFVYLGNVADQKGSTTFCPSCQQPVIIRRGYAVDKAGLDGANCRFCGTSLPIVV